MLRKAPSHPNNAGAHMYIQPNGQPPHSQQAQGPGQRQNQPQQPPQGQQAGQHPQSPQLTGPLPGPDWFRPQLGSPQPQGQPQPQPQGPPQQQPTQGPLQGQPVQQTPQQAQQQPDPQQQVQPPQGMRQSMMRSIAESFQKPSSMAPDGLPLHPDMHALLTRQKVFVTWGVVLFLACCGICGIGSIVWTFWGLYLIYELKSQHKPAAMPMKLKVGAGVYIVWLVHLPFTIWALMSYVPALFNAIFGDEYIS